LEEGDNEDGKFIMAMGKLKQEVKDSLKVFATNGLFQLTEGLVKKLHNHPDKPIMGALMDEFKEIKKQIEVKQKELVDCNHSTLTTLDGSFQALRSSIDTKVVVLKKKHHALELLDCTVGKNQRAGYLHDRHKKEKVGNPQISFRALNIWTSVICVRQSK
jgi:hypothetical protein